MKSKIDIWQVVLQKACLLLILICLLFLLGFMVSNLLADVATELQTCVT